MTASYSRCELGRRCVKKTKDNKVFKKYTLVSAISSKGIVGWILYESGGMTSNRMVEFINKFIKDKFKNYLVIMDNGGAHKSNLVKEAIINSWSDIESDDGAPDMSGEFPVSGENRRRATLGADGWIEGKDRLWRKSFDNAEWLPKCDIGYVTHAVVRDQRISIAVVCLGRSGRRETWTWWQR